MNADELARLQDDLYHEKAARHTDALRAEELRGQIDRLRASHAELVKAIREYLQWGAMTGSDRDMFDNIFRAALDNAAAIEDAARMSAGFGEALELTKRAVES